MCYIFEKKACTIYRTNNATNSVLKPQTMHMEIKQYKQLDRDRTENILYYPMLL